MFLVRKMGETESCRQKTKQTDGTIVIKSIADENMLLKPALQKTENCFSFMKETPGRREDGSKWKRKKKKEKKEQRQERKRQ